MAILLLGATHKRAFPWGVKEEDRDDGGAGPGGGGGGGAGKNHTSSAIVVGSWNKCTSIHRSNMRYHKKVRMPDISTIYYRAAVVQSNTLCSFSCGAAVGRVLRRNAAAGDA